MALDASQQKAASAVVAAAQKPGVISQYIDDIKVKTWSETNWALMLGAAPVCLELLGSSCLVSSSDVALTTKLTPPKEGFKHLKGFDYLSAHLVTVSNQGSTAFLLARRNMARIGQNSKDIKYPLLDIVKILKDANYDDTLLHINLDTVKSAAQRCVKDSQEMDLAFTEWLNFVLELHTACQEQQSREATLFREVLSKEKSQKVWKEEQENMLKDQKELVEKMDEKVKEAQQQYKDAVDKFPTGKDLMLNELAVIGAETAAALVKIAGNAAAAYFSPASAFTGTADALKDTNSKNGSNDTQTNSGTGSNDKGKKKKSSSNANADLALYRSAVLLKAVQRLDEMLDANGKVDWEALISKDEEKGKDSKKTQEMDFVGVEDVLRRVEKGINDASDEKSSPIGKKLLSIITDVNKVMDKLGVDVANSLDASWKRPDDKDAKIVGWRNSVSKARSETEKLQAKSKGSSRRSPGAPPVAFQPPAEDPKASAKARSNLTQATIENAKNLLNTTLEGYLAQEEMANKMKEGVLKTQEELANVRRELAELGEQKVTLTEVKRVLTDCIAYLLQLKSQIAKLTQFFNVVAMLVSTTVENQIVPFTKMVEKSGNERLKGNMVRQFMMTTILHYVLEIAARFDLYVDISEMYVEVNDNHILPGFTIVDKMGAVTAAGEEGRKQLQEKNKELQKYSAGAQTGIGEIITKKTEKVTAGSRDRIAKLQALLSDPALPESSRPQSAAVIKEGMQEATRQIEARVEESEGPIKYLTQPKEVRDQNQGQLADATSLSYQQKQVEKQMNEQQSPEEDEDVW